MQGQTHEGGVPAGQVILDGVVDQPNQLTVAVHQNRDEQIALRGWTREEVGKEMERKRRAEEGREREEKRRGRETERKSREGF